MVKHSVEQLLAVACRYYPHGMTQDHPEYSNTPEFRALKQASLAAGQERPKWLAMLDRIRDRFPECMVDGHALHLAAGSPAACYPGELSFPRTRTGPDHRIGFQVSFLAPYYAMYGYCSFPSDGDRSTIVRLEPDELERPYWQTIAQQIEATWQVEPMPPQIGYVSVPGVQPGSRLPCDAMIYDCFFDDHPRLISETDGERVRRENLALAVAIGHWALLRILEGRPDAVEGIDVVSALVKLEPALTEVMSRRDAGYAVGGLQAVTLQDVDKLKRLRLLLPRWPQERDAIERIALELLHAIGGA